MKFNALKFIFKGVCVILTLCILLCLTAGAEPSPQRGEHPEALEDTLNLPCKSAILVEANTGTVLYEKNADEPLPPASVTKVMTLLLVMEAIDSGKIGYGDTVRASANACSMGGSQIYLKENEEMTVEDLLKSVIIASANDAAVALAEHICGSEEAFVDKMNEKAQMLGMKNTHFENTNGLDDTTQNHVISARDIAIVSRELIKHKKVIEYSSIWMDSIRNGSFGLTNTNRLIRFYNGATGLKTGSTDKAGFCISATAKRGEMELIAVIMGSETRDERNSAATKLLDYGFNNYRIFSDDGGVIDNIPISKGERASFSAEYPKIKMIVPKETGKISAGIQISENIEAPVKSGDIVGIVSYTDGKGEICQIDIIACENVKRLSFWSGFMLLLKKCAEML
jgi:D-alanyl-D-alanine carboxypeptidase (penicillin-binding protein 5/6)